MKLNLVHLFPELMSLYGEYANLALLRRRLEQLGAEVTITPVDCDAAPDFSAADLIYMGAGTERSRKFALERLLPHADALKAAAARGAVLLFTGSAMPLLGASITDAAGKAWPALRLAEFTTEESEKRIGEDVVAMPTLWEDRVVGFMNKSSVTRGVDSPLFSALPLGFGNETSGGAEGYVSGNVFATHLTGPVLVKNPAFTDLVIERLFALKEEKLPEGSFRLPHEAEAYAVTLRELLARIR